MSRTIFDKKSIKLTKEEQSLQNTSDGKLILTTYKGRNCALLLKGSRLLYASFEQHSLVGAIYIGKVQKKATNMDSCFVEINKNEVCFLPMKQACFSYILNRNNDGRVLQGDEILVQITRDAQKTKQASVTSHISLSNPYFVLSLGDGSIRFSNKLSQKQKDEIQSILLNAQILRKSESELKLELPGTFPSISLLIRTKSAFLTAQQLLLEYQKLLDSFLEMLKNAKHRTAYSCVREAFDFYTDVIENQVSAEEYNEIITDNPVVYDRIIQIPGCEQQLRYYADSSFPLALIYSIPNKLEEALNERVWLKSGGYLVIQPTEALTVIDVNSGKYEVSRQIDQEEASLKINLEAAEEIAVQLRLRNLSGIIVVDFINMKQKENVDVLLQTLKTLVAFDKVTTRIVDLTKLGLVEITRKKIRKPLYEQYQNRSQK